MLRAILNKSWRQHPIEQQLYGHLLPITKTIQVRRTRHAGHYWRSRDELISDVLHSHVRAKAGWPARTYIQQLYSDTGCRSEDIPEAMSDREGWRERVRNSWADGMTWWWWWWLLYNSSHYHNTQRWFLLAFKIYKQEKGVPVVYWLSSQEMDTATRVRTLDETDCISHRTNTNYESNYSPSSYG